MSFESAVVSQQFPGLRAAVHEVATLPKLSSLLGGFEPTPSEKICVKMGSSSTNRDSNIMTFKTNTQLNIEHQKGRNKGCISGLIKGNQWLIKPYLLGRYVWGDWLIGHNGG